MKHNGFQFVFHKDPHTIVYLDSFTFVTSHSQYLCTIVSHYVSHSFSICITCFTLFHIICIFIFVLCFTAGGPCQPLVVPGGPWLLPAVHCGPWLLLKVLVIGQSPCQNNIVHALKNHVLDLFDEISWFGSTFMGRPSTFVLYGRTKLRV